MTLRIAELITDEAPVPFWKLLRQVGVTEVVATLPRLPADWRNVLVDQPWSYARLARHAATIRGEGFEIAAIEDNPPMDNARFGRPGRDEEIDNVCTMLRSMGRLGIPLWCYNWAAGLGWIRTHMSLAGRGGARVSGYDHAFAEAGGVSEFGTARAEQLWDNLDYFLERVLPVAESAGVKLALHPDDPPMLDTIRGIDRIAHNPQAFERLLERYPSEFSGITFCQGNFTLMTDRLPDLIRTLGRTGRIFYVHFRDVKGTPDSFIETFHDEGPTDMLAAMFAYRDIGFSGVMRSDHVPLLEGDTQSVAGYSVLGRLHAVGYITALREAAYHPALQEVHP